MSWTKFLDIKDSQPIDTAEYAVVQGIDSESAFNWWVLHMIQKMAHIIFLVKKRSTCYLKKHHDLESRSLSLQSMHLRLTKQWQYLLV